MTEARGTSHSIKIVESSEFDRKYDILDVQTPRQTLMCGRYKKSFAFYTLRERLPVILTNIIDNLTKDKEELVAKYSEESREELKTVIGAISELKYRLQTDKPLEEFEGNDTDKPVWNEFLSKLPNTTKTFFSACWLYSECYMYRRVSDIFASTVHLKDHDYFEKQKRNAVIISMDEMELIARVVRTLTASEDNFIRLLKLQLWGNRCDMSISSGKEVRPNANTLDILSSLDSNILINQTKDIWDCLLAADRSKTIIVDIVLDNAGFELYTDFVLADYLIEHKLAHKVRFHTKAIPWFISDVRHADFEWTLNHLAEHGGPRLMELAKKWLKFVREGKFELQPVEYFWTGPYEYYRMREVRPELYKTLCEAHLIIFKGDLNYRKLIGDFAWEFSEAFLTCLRGFQPSNLCTLRTVKADLICGMREDHALELFKETPDWMVTGEYGVIQYAKNTLCNSLGECEGRPVQD